MSTTWSPSCGSSPSAGAANVPVNQVIGAVSARNALIPSGTLHTPAQDFPVQLSGEFKSETELLDTIVGQSQQGTPIHLRDFCVLERGSGGPRLIGATRARFVPLITGD